jgi:two-component system sensor histidine kinase SenX3
VTAVLVAAVVGLALALVLLLTAQRRDVGRIVDAASKLGSDGSPTRTGLAGAAALVERVVDDARARGGDISLAEARLASALAAVPQGVVVFDSDRGIAFRNEAAAAYLTARHGEVLVEEAINELADEVVDSHGSAVRSRTVDLFGPPRRTLVLRCVALEANSEVVGALVVIDDVTERRRLEAVRRDFVANISHELKTPVGALGLLAETLLAEDDPVVIRRLAERLLDEAFRVGRTIDDLLELSRIEADEAPANEEVSVQRFVADAVERMRGAAEQQGIDLDVDQVPAGLAVRGDRRQLVSATYNLLENAVKYSDRGSAVQVRARTEGDWIELTVEDHGIGIPRRDLERIFERFYRVDRARSRETGGTGLGLAIVRHVANNHAGQVRVVSHEGEGSTFTLRLPVGNDGPVAITAEAG